MDRPTKKITVKLSKALHANFKKLLEESCIQRDLYLDIVLQHEAKMLDIEVKKANSKKAKQFIKRNLRHLNTVLVSLTLSNETILSVDDVCNRKNIPRDAFINRVLLFLMMRKERFNELLDINVVWWIQNQMMEDEGSNIAFQATDVGLLGISNTISRDPFWAIRSCIEYQNKETPDTCALLHCSYIDENFNKKDEKLTGLNCFVDNRRIEGTKENYEWLHMFDDLLELGKKSKAGGHKEER